MKYLLVEEHVIAHSITCKMVPRIAYENEIHVTFQTRKASYIGKLP